MNVAKHRGARPQSPRGCGRARTALEVLVRVARERAFADVLLGHRLAGFAAPDRRLVTQLVLGTIAWQGRLDYELERVSSRALDTLAPEVLAVLRMALFQLRILTRVPPHAAVDTAVTLARECAGEGLGRFVNAVLRNALRRPVKRPARDRDELAYLAVVHSHPRWLVAKFIEWFGARDAEALLAANNQAAPNVLRLNLARGRAEEIAARLEREGFDCGARTISRNGRAWDCPAIRCRRFARWCLLSAGGSIATGRSDARARPGCDRR